MPQPEAPKPNATPDPFAGLVPGRIVLYAPTITEQRQAHEAGPWPAMVTKVGPLPGVVTLNVNLPMPLSIGSDPVQRRTEVPYSREGSEGTWAWMFEGQGTRYRSDPPSALPKLT